MKLTDYITGKPVEIAILSIYEMHTRGPYTEIKTDFSIDENARVTTSRYTVKETVPQIMDMIRKESSS